MMDHTNFERRSMSRIDFSCRSIVALAIGLGWVTSIGHAAEQEAATRTTQSDCGGIASVVGGEARCLRTLENFQDCAQCPEMIALPAGTFEMGSPEDELGRSNSEGPEHCVRIKYHLAVAKYEATFAEWDNCVAAGGCKHVPRDSGWGRGRQPVINVSWEDAFREYIPWLSKAAGQTYRLLTEAEWEYAARSSTTTEFSTGKSITSDDANFDGTSTYAGSAKGVYRQKPLEVGGFAPNAFGLYDMHGNVWEWVADCFTSNYMDTPTDGSAARDVPNCQRVMRGGSWIDSPRVLRSAARGHVPAHTRFIYRGFRVARVITGDPQSATASEELVPCP
jgi:formylglycine-generating enzyme required for sulfatase activity